jgi:hypothetical protein
MGGLPPDLDLILSQPQLLWRFLIIFEVGISVLVVNVNSNEQVCWRYFFLGTQRGT